MQINPCREALTAGLEGSDEERCWGIVALIDQLRRSATGMLKQNGDDNDVTTTITGRPLRYPQQLDASDNRRCRNDRL
jgi:hypothetical protein